MCIAMIELVNYPHSDKDNRSKFKRKGIVPIETIPSILGIYSGLASPDCAMANPNPIGISAMVMK